MSTIIVNIMLVCATAANITPSTCMPAYWPAAFATMEECNVQMAEGIAHYLNRYEYVRAACVSKPSDWNPETPEGQKEIFEALGPGV